jgi:hypothetical protein
MLAHGSRAARRVRLAVAALAALSYGRVGPLALGPEAFAATFLDDAFYYFTVARHLAAGEGSTFDGLHATNGYQPLWLGVLALVFRAVPGDFAPVVVAALLESFLLVLAVLLAFDVLETRIGTAAAAASSLGLLALPGATTALRGGMESALLLLVVVAAWRAFQRVEASPEDSAGPWAAVGAGAALAYLARFEALALVPAAVLVRPSVLRRPAALACLLGPPALAVAAHVAVNLVSFGTVLAVSGRVRMAIAEDVPLAARLAQGALLTAVVAAVVLRRRALVPAVRAAGVAFPLAGSAIAYLVHKAILHYTQPWDRTFAILATALAIAALLAGRPRVARSVAAVAAVLVLLSSGVEITRLYAAPQGNYVPHRLAAARWLREQVDESAPVGSWNAGMIGYFSHRHVVNLDGFVNDRDYLETVVRGRRLAEYLTREGIAWLADQACGPRPSPRAYLARGGAADLAPQFALVATFQGPGGCPGTAIWRRVVD